SVVFDGFSYFDPSQAACLEALARRTRVVVRMPRGADTALSDLEGRWHSLESAPDIELVELSLPADVALYEAKTDDGEARAVARQAQRAFREGTPPERIAIVLPELEDRFLDLLRASLGEARVPFREPAGRPHFAAPAVSAALAWLDLASG